MKLPRVNRTLATIAGSLTLLGVGTYLYASLIESRRYRLEKVRVTTYGASGNGRKNVEPAVQPALKILHLSDLHLCEPESHKVEFISRITEEEYDLVVLTGDIFENYSGLRYAKQMLSRKPKYGAYAVLGNHDYYDYNMMHKTFGRLVKRYRHPSEKKDVQPLVKALEGAGFNVLRNECQTITEAGLHIVGIDYPTIERRLLKELVAQAPKDHLVLALFHVPANLRNLTNSGVHLALGGHTHGGQVRIPGYGAIITDSELPRGYASGLFFLEDTAFHISRGLGADPRTNFRLFCPPAATVVEVTRNFANSRL